MLPDPPLTKRQLGWLLILAGGLATLAALGADLVRGHAFGLGPVRLRVLEAGLLLLGLGFSLIPLGRRPA